MVLNNIENLGWNHTLEHAVIRHNFLAFLHVWTVAYEQLVKICAGYKAVTACVGAEMQWHCRFHVV